MKSVYIWSAIDLKNESSRGVIHAVSSRRAKDELRKKGFFKINVTPLPANITQHPLATSELLKIVQSLSLLMGSGLSIQDTFSLLSHSKQTLVEDYVFSHIWESLRRGKSLGDAFQSLNPLFPPFFITMIRLCEKSEDVSKGLEQLTSFYRRQEKSLMELRKLSRYPKILLSITLVIGVGITYFIVPMFDSIYAMYGDNLPPLTRLLVSLSSFLHRFLFPCLLCFFFLVFAKKIPLIKTISPLFALTAFVRRRFRSREDLRIYANSMSILLDSGLKLNLAIQQAAECLSAKNRRYGNLLIEKLNSGTSFSSAFSEISWFPPIFKNHIQSAEKAGSLSIGFQQIFRLLTQRQEDRYSKIIRLIEPLMMLIVGAVALTILLAIYLPIFDLGNTLG